MLKDQREVKVILNQQLKFLVYLRRLFDDGDGVELDGIVEEVAFELDHLLFKRELHRPRRRPANPGRASRSSLR